MTLNLGFDLVGRQIGDVGDLRGKESAERKGQEITRVESIGTPCIGSSRLGCAGWISWIAGIVRGIGHLEGRGMESIARPFRVAF